MIFTGTANPRLAVDVVNHLDMSLGKMTVGRFSDGEVTIEIKQNVRTRDVFVVQSTCAPTNAGVTSVTMVPLKRPKARPIARPAATSATTATRRISENPISNMIQSGYTS